MELTPERITIIGGLLAILAAGYKRVWVWGRDFLEEREEKEEWKSMALGLLKTNEKVVDKVAKDA